MQNMTPLRYPGGKSLMAPLFIDLLKINDVEGCTYAEPYAGGAGAAINLLLGGYVSRIMINDANVAIFSFWKYLKEENERMIHDTLSCKVTLESWHRMKKIFMTSKEPCYELAFATFFLSRTNRSGILNAGPIGGSTCKKQEEAVYKIDCRFNREDLARRIENIGKKKTHIEVSNKDALKFLKDLRKNDYFVYLDPPYYQMGQSLYMNYYHDKEHRELASYLKETKKFKWILSYDDNTVIRDIYKDFCLYTFPLSYRVQKAKSGKELLCLSKDLQIPSPFVIRRNHSKSIPIEELNNK